LPACSPTSARRFGSRDEAKSEKAEKWVSDFAQAFQNDGISFRSRKIEISFASQEPEAVSVGETVSFGKTQKVNQPSQE
jgi:hypothetical protein